MPIKGPRTPDRLKKRSDFLRVQAQARKWVAPSVIVQVGTGETAGIRVGFTATKKLGNAVIRNRVKRRLRAAARAVMAELILPYDIVLIGRAETATCDYAALLKDLKWCLKRLSVIGNQSSEGSAI